MREQRVVHTIRTLRTAPGRPPLTVEDQVRLVQRRSLGTFALPTAVDAAAPPAQAAIQTVEHLRRGHYITRWIVFCPDCAGAEDGDPADARFFCMSCFNSGCGGRWRRVAYPDDREVIEALVLARSEPGTRAYLPGETLADIRAQNLRLGDPITVVSEVGEEP